MNLRRQVLNGVAVIGAGQALGHVLSFVRNIIVARLVGPEDFGIAATFALTVSLLEMISDLGADKLIIQAEDGDDPRLQAAAHLWQLSRESVSALLILVLAWPLSLVFQVPHTRWAFYCLALVPLLRGFLHLDIKRLQRHLRFAPQTYTEVGAQFVATAVAWPLAWWLRDYSAMLWIVIAHAGVSVLLTHLGAQRAYRLGWDRGQLARLITFGWPLLVNGLLMFAVLQGDRALVGAFYSMHALGLYAVAFALAYAPVQMLVSLASGITLPLLSRVQSDAREFERRYALCAAGLAAAGGALTVTFVLAGPHLLTWTFGAAFRDAALCLILLAAAQSVRLLRVGTTIAAMARSDTVNSMGSNAWRITGLAAAGAAACFGAPLAWIAAAALLGEIAALAYSLARLARLHALSVAHCLSPSFAVLPAVAGAVLARSAGFCGGATMAVVATAAVVAGCLLSVVLASPAVRGQVARCWPFHVPSAGVQTDHA